MSSAVPAVGPDMEAGALARLLVSPMTGLLRRVTISPWSGDDLRVQVAAGELAAYGRLPGLSDIDATGGAGLSADEAATRILFETVERYCGAFVDRSRAVRSRPTSAEFLYGDRLPLYTEAQYARPDWQFRPLRADSTIWWTRGVSLLTGETRYVPSALVHIPYYAESDQECIGPSVSTGMAAGRSWEEACRAGLLEVCERDAFAIMWMNRLSMPRLVVRRGSRLARDLGRALGGSEASVTFVDISNDAGIPVVAAILRHSWLGKPVVSVGASAKRSLEGACRKAFAEAANGYTYIVSQLEAGTRGYSGPDFSGITEWRLHPLVYLDPAMQRELDFMTASAVEREIADPALNDAGDGDAGRLSALTDRLRSVFGEIAAVNLTTREFAEIGVCVAKVFIPEAVPLHPDHRYTGLAHRRLFEVPRRLGYSATDTSAALLNPLPHPFS